MNIQSTASNIIDPGQGDSILSVVEAKFGQASAALTTTAKIRASEAELLALRLARKLVRESKPRGKFWALSVVILSISSLCYLGFLAQREFASDSRLHEAQGQQLAQLKADVFRVNQQLDQLGSLKNTVTQNQQQLSGLVESNRNILAGLARPTTLWSTYNEGVCLISGSYVFVDDKTGLPLRLRKREPAEAGQPLLPDQEKFTTSGDGPLAEVNYEGTGFHVGQGYILTNRHLVVEPWQYDFISQLFSTVNKAQPRLVGLVAYFPGQRRGYALNFKEAGPRYNIAVCKLKVATLPALPILPLERDVETAKVGEAVLMMGYPAGAQRLVASLPETETKQLQERYGESTGALVEHLAQRNLIKPMTTQGHVVQLQPDQIVCDAASGQGGSGAPVFGPAGRVIGIHFGFFPQDRMSNYAAPIGRSLPLLRRAGWKPEHSW